MHSIYRLAKNLPILAGLAIALNGCKWETYNYTIKPQKISALQSIPYNTPVEIHVPTYDGSNQAVHPDILPINHSAWPGASLAMAFTPYPNSNDKLENPSLVISNDGINFYEPLRGMNPLVPAPPIDHNDDPDISYNPQTGYYNLYYLETCRPDSQSIICMMSRDLSTWGKQKAIHYNLKDNKCFALSPALIQDETNYWSMFYVNTWGRPTRIEYLMSNNGLDWQQNDYMIPTHTNKPPMIPWHLDVFKGGDVYYMLICGLEPHPNLYIARSTDLHNWEWATEPILTPHTATLKSKRIYRSSGFIQDNDLYVYFSFAKEAKQWGVGMVKYPLSQLF